MHPHYVPVRACRPISPGETLEGAEGIVDLWWYSYDWTAQTMAAGAYEDLLAPEERDRYRRFRFEAHRCLFLATRALLRTTLSRYVAIAPSEWRFAYDESGKPRVVRPAVIPTLHFNVANTAGLVACAVSVAHESVGVDVERVGRELDLPDLADTCLSASESAAFRALPARERARRFFTYWTLKESYLKARGLGLTLPLDRLSFALHDSGIGIALHPEISDDAAQWRFALLEAPHGHVIAVGAKTRGMELSLRTAQLPI